jgi:hypothetical protein
VRARREFLGVAIMSVALFLPVPSYSVPSSEVPIDTGPTGAEAPAVSNDDVPAASAVEAEYRHELLDERAPEAVSKDIRAALSPRASRILGKDGKPFVDVWWRTKLEAGEDPGGLGVDFGALLDGSVLAVLRYHVKGSDFRGFAIDPGVYTIRKVTQPEDGDHLGASDTRDFVVVCPVDEDTKLERLGTKKAIELSTKVTKKKHPATLYLIRPFDESKEFPRLGEDEDRDLLYLDVELETLPVPEDVPAGKTKAKIRVGLVLVGEAREA